MVLKPDPTDPQETWIKHKVLFRKKPGTKILESWFEKLYSQRNPHEHKRVEISKKKKLLLIRLHKCPIRLAIVPKFLPTPTKKKKTIYGKLGESGGLRIGGTFGRHSSRFACSTTNMKSLSSGCVPRIHFTARRVRNV